MKRGCVNNLKANETESCYNEDNDSCKLCFGDDCNNKINPQTCYTCDSNVDLNCVNNLNTSYQHQCKNYYDKCFTFVNNDQVIRGCLNEHSDMEDPCSGEAAFCHTCEDDNCNSEAAADDIVCYSCDSVNDPNCESALNNTMLETCPLSTHNLGCYHYNDGLF